MIKTLINKIYLIGLASIITTCGTNKSKEIRNCINLEEVKSKGHINRSYKIDTIEIVKRNINARIHVKEQEGFQFNAEREYIFYIFSGLKKCEGNSFDSLKVLFLNESNEVLPFNYSSSQAIKDLNLHNLAFESFLAYVLSKSNYRDLALIFNHYLGVALNNNPDGMFNVDFFEFVLNYIHDIEINNPDSYRYQILLKLENIVSNSGVLPDIKINALDTIAYLKNLVSHPRSVSSKTETVKGDAIEA